MRGRCFWFDKNFIKSCNEENNQRYFLEVDVQYPKKLHDFQNDLTFSTERRKS